MRWSLRSANGGEQWDWRRRRGSGLSIEEDELKELGYRPIWAVYWALSSSGRKAQHGPFPSLFCFGLFRFRSSNLETVDDGLRLVHSPKPQIAAASAMAAGSAAPLLATVAGILLVFLASSVSGELALFILANRKTLFSPGRNQNLS